jgi:hypothetical protein
MLVANLLSLYVDALKLSRQERNAYWNVLSMLEQRTSAPLHRLLGHPETCYVEYNSWQRRLWDFHHSLGMESLSIVISEKVRREVPG